MPDTYLVYDTETTSLPRWHEPSDSEGQPHIVQLTALLTDENGNKLSSMDVMVRPDGWKIPEDVIKFHGITEEKANRGGVGEETAIEMFWDLLSRASLRVAHVDSFDYRILRIAFKRYGWHDDLLERWKAFPNFCTAKAATPIVKAAATAKMHATGRHGAKKPTLAEAYKFFTGKELIGAHNAMIDVLACKAVFFGIMDHEGVDRPAMQTKKAKADKPKPAAEPKSKSPESDLI